MPTRSRNYLLLFILSFFMFSIPDALSQTSIQVANDHPRLFITSNNLATFQTRAATTHRDTYQIIRAWCDQYWDDSITQQKVFTIYDDRDYDAGVLRYALIYILGQIPGFDYSQHSINDYGDKAIAIMLNIINAHPSSDWTTGLQFRHIAVAYDWVNAKMSAVQKQTVVNWFHAIIGDIPSLNTSYIGYRFVKTPNCFYPGLAFYGDGINDTLAQTYVNFIPTYLEALREISHVAGIGGGSASGLGYGWYSFAGGYNGGHLAHDFWALTTATNLTINDTFNIISAHQK